MPKRLATLSGLHVHNASSGAAEVEVEARPNADNRKEPGLPRICEGGADADSTSGTPPPRPSELPEPAKPFGPSRFCEVGT